MLKRLTFVLLLIPFMLILTQCSGDESTTNPVDPPAGYSGIRLTDKLGNILTGDSLDWCFPESLAAVPQVGTRAVIPTSYAFYPAYPNPNTEPEMRDISIVYDLPVAGEVELYIMDKNDSIVKTLVDEGQAAGRYLVTWDQLDNQGFILDTGVYRCALSSGDFECTGDIDVDVILDYVEFTSVLANDTMKVSYDAPKGMGAVYLRVGIDGTAGDPIFSSVIGNMSTLMNNYGDSLKILIVTDIFDFYALPSGEHHLLSIPYEGFVSLDSVQVSDSLGTLVPVRINNQ